MRLSSLCLASLLSTSVVAFGPTRPSVGNVASFVNEIVHFVVGHKGTAVALDTRIQERRIQPTMFKITFLHLNQSMLALTWMELSSLVVS